MSREQYGFKIEVEVIIFGEDYGECFDRAMGIAEGINRESIDDLCEIVVRDTGSRFFKGIPHGVYCEGCEGHIVPGTRWPAASNNDSNHEWVERCDSCTRFDSDEQAADAIAEFYSEASDDFIRGEAIPVGSTSPQPYFDRKD